MMLGRGNFVERSVMGVLAFLKDAVFAQDRASSRGFLQSLDPRIKTAAFLVLVISCILAKGIPALLWLYVACLCMALVSGIGLGFFLIRTWVFIPLFSFCIALPALSSVFTPGEPLWTVDILFVHLVITRTGFLGVLVFLLRVTTSVSLVVLLNLTTRHAVLLKVLRTFGIPRIFVMVLGMCYRYIYLFIEILQNTYLAIKSRTGTCLPQRKGRQVVAWKVSALWQKSLHLNEEVYNAMLSRGYTGEPRVADEFKTHPRDWAWLVLVFVLAGVSLWAM
ncbi:MAG TPA: cobalt ECF transporter T component CbiQ [Patescibacteria group bacterium]|nr:cobalt ECF transporter T component CbiQ [Patescibacteria group bacterium]